MDEQTVRKTFKCEVKPTPEQQRAMAFALRRCRELYNAGLQGRREARRKGGIGIALASQSAHLPEVREARPDHRDIHSQALQDVLTRLERAFQPFFRRVKNGETPGYSRLQGVNRYQPFTDR
jgi:putative transposase